MHRFDAIEYSPGLTAAQRAATNAMFERFICQNIHNIVEQTRGRDEAYTDSLVENFRQFALLQRHNTQPEDADR